MTVFNGARVRTLRLEARIGIDDLAVAAGISPNTVRYAKSGIHQPRPRVISALAQALGVPVDELLPSGTALTLRHTDRRLGVSQAEMAARPALVGPRLRSDARSMGQRAEGVT